MEYLKLTLLQGKDHIVTLGKQSSAYFNLSADVCQSSARFFLSDITVGNVFVEFYRNGGYEANGCF